MKRLLNLLIITMTLTLPVLGQSMLTPKGDAAIKDFLQLRMELTEFQDNKAKAVENLNSYWSKITLSDFSEQEALILESFYYSELYNYIWDDKSNDKMLQDIFTKQIEKNDKFIESNEGNVSDWMYMNTADCYSNYMSYNPVSGAMKYGTKVKKYYEKALEINPKNSTCRTHYAQWFYWAPGISGGGKKKALSQFKTAMEDANTPADKFYAYIFYSQIALEQIDSKTCSEYLNKAKEIFPKSTYVTELEYWNGRGYSLFGKDKKKAEEERNVSTSY